MPDTKETILKELGLCEIPQEWGGQLAQSPVGLILALAVRYRYALERIDNHCRCIPDPAKPCALCAELGRKAAVIAHQAINT